ncbi:hypothetical protein KP509_15G077000 [Ceratopteris richardii]|nr:hypothetical protein KP509_15G077000 [Ceratopteris richardii]
MHPSLKFFDKTIHRCGDVQTALAVFRTKYLADQTPDKVRNKDKNYECTMAAVYFDQQEMNFVTLAKAYAASKDLEKASVLHAHVTRLGLIETDLFLASALIHMYAKCGSVTKAQQVFDSLVRRDVVIWTTLIAGYAEHGPYENAFKCNGLMQQEGICPNSFTLVSLLKACSHLVALDKGEAIYFEAVLKGYASDELTGNSLIDMYTKCRRLAEATAVFNSLCRQNVVSWTALIGGFIDCGQSKEALQLYGRMEQSGISPNPVTYIYILKGCASMIALTEGQQIHTQIVLKGLEDDNNIGNTLIDMYFKCGLCTDAETCFGKLRLPDIISWNILVEGYSEHSSFERTSICFEKMQSKGFPVTAPSSVSLLKACMKLPNLQKAIEVHLIAAKIGLDRKLPVANTLVDIYGKLGLLIEAQNTFNNLPIRSLVSWNVLIGSYAEHGYVEEALKYYYQLQYSDFYPDVITFISILKVCACTGNSQKVQEMHLEIVKLGMEGLSQVANCLIHMYATFGSLTEAQQIFKLGHSVRNVVTWTALMIGWAQSGNYVTVMTMFCEMIQEGIIPNDITLTCVLNSCSDAGILSINEAFFLITHAYSDFIPTLEHYTCVVDFVGRAGLTDKAMGIIDGMPINPDVCIWLSVLGACWNSHNVELGKVAFENVLSLDKKSEAAYICMYNIFIEAGMIDEAVAIELRRLQQCT